MKKWARLSPEQFQTRIIELETLYTQKQLSSVLGISRDSLRRYATGKTTPQSREVYNKINRLYNTKKAKVEQGKVEAKRQKIKKQSEAQTYGRIKNRYASIFPEYMYSSPATDFQDSRGWDKLLSLSERGYVAGWRGRDIIPLEVQFLAEGEGTPLTRFGKIVNMVCAVSRITSPKDGINFWEVAEIAIFQSYYRLINGLKKTDDFETRTDKIRDFASELKVDRGYIVAFLGFYFEEGDELD